MKHLVIVDGHHLMYRAYWAIPRTMKNGKGEQVNTAFGVASMLMQILKTEEPDSLLFCFDAGEETFRHAEYAEYKKGRAETPDDFYVQIPRTLELIDTFGIRSVSGKNYEADDYACSYARAAEREGLRTTIVTGDRDLFQLASDTIRISIPHKGYQAAEYLRSQEVKTKYGVTPEQIPAYKGLVGDSSDNLSGVLGIGPKAAMILLQQFPTLEELYENLDKVKPSYKAKLEAGKKDAFFCARMALLKCDIDLSIPLADLKFKDIRTSPIMTLFTDLEFSLLKRRFLEFLGTPYGKAHFLLDHASELESLAKVSQKVAVAAAKAAVTSSQLSLL